MNFANKYKLIPFLLILILLISSCDVLMADGEEILEASGVVEAIEVVVSPELGGRVAEVFKQEGDEVEVGEILFRLEGDLLGAQREQALAALEMANAQLATSKTSLEAAHAALTAAEAGVNIANIQYELELDNARLIEQPERIEAWKQEIPKEFSLPTWYFQKVEEISAAESEVEEAQEALEVEEVNFESVLEEVSHAGLRAAEERLLKAQIAFLIAEELTDRKIHREGKEELEDYLEIIYDNAEAELEAAQSAYEKILSDQSASDVLEARARLTVARERYNTALDQFNALLTGEHSKALRASEAVVFQAESAVGQAHANINQAESGIAQGERMVDQAQAALNLIDLQIEKLKVPSAVAGIVMTRNIEPGEIIQPGMAAFTIGQLDQLTVKVYVPENLYGQISLGDQSSVSVDSFPGQVFNATVIRIADRAEYTPRNVQTQEDRQTTVFEIELSVEDPQGQLKPGMPADVSFQ
ncbi:MAG: efflux RND transporter periplasmic adaptor subunit [Chloroflexi bacterium]|nr:efflux RND transporter periplasmic adaptor subunit [Chloroflexota bacterium]